MASFSLDTQITFMCRTLVRLPPHKWRRVVQPELPLRRYLFFFSCYDFCVIYLPIVCFLKLAFPALDLFCCFGLFVWLSTHLDLDLGEQNITQGRLSCSANPHWLTVTLRPLWPIIARSCTGNWFSINESSLFLVSALMCLNMSTRGHIHQNMYFQFYQEYLCSAEKTTLILLCFERTDWYPDKTLIAVHLP